MDSTQGAEGMMMIVSYRNVAQFVAHAAAKEHGVMPLQLRHANPSRSALNAQAATMLTLRWALPKHSDRAICKMAGMPVGRSERIRSWASRIENPKTLKQMLCMTLALASRST